LVNLGEASSRERVDRGTSAAGASAEAGASTGVNFSSNSGLSGNSKYSLFANFGSSI
jgi:hypothetical protein